MYEGELGIVIGAVCKDAPEDEAERCIFGYTCVNDVTAADIIQKDPNVPAVGARKELRRLRPVRAGDRDQRSS